MFLNIPPIAFLLINKFSVNNLHPLFIYGILSENLKQEEDDDANMGELYACKTGLSVL